MNAMPDKNIADVPGGSTMGPPTLRPAPSDPLHELRLQLQAQTVRIAELEGDLRAAEDQVHRLEAQLRVRTAKAMDLQRAALPAEDGSVAPADLSSPLMLATTPDMAALFATADASHEHDEAEADEVDDGNWRMVPSAAEPSASDAASSEAAPSSDDAAPAARRAASSPASEGQSRFLVLMDGDTEVVHLLGRRTTLGRDADNDIQIDQQFVSRNHALIIAGPNQTVIEDLHSTNGLLVNGERVQRSLLADGDVIVIGKTQFRFARRRS